MNRDLGTMEGGCKLTLRDAERESLRKLSMGMPTTPCASTEDFLGFARSAYESFPRPLSETLVQYRRSGNVEGALLIRGWPIDEDLPATPADSRRSKSKKTFLSELWLAATAVPLGEAVAYIQEKDGELFQNICPTRQNEEMFSSESSKIFLPFHTELAFHPFMPSFVSLYCLRADHNRLARTLVASIREIVPLLSEGERQLLEQPVFETGIDYSFGSANARRGGGLVTPILYGDLRDPYFRFDPDLMTAYTTEAQELMVRVNAIAQKAANHAYLEPGDMLVIDNRRSVHARTQFEARYDGQDRWLQRLCIVDKLPDSPNDRNLGERIIRTQFLQDDQKHSN